MKLSQLLSIFPELRWGDAAASEVSQLTQDSRQVNRGTVFVAIRGTTGDGHDFLATAVKQGATALIVEDETKIPATFTGAVAKVASTRVALDQLAQRFYRNPGAELFCIGVTGTNGKTTVTYMIEAILNQYGWPTGVLGTIDHHLGAKAWPSRLTTPDAVTLQRRLREFVDLGARAVAFEVSSHALSQARVDGVPFKAAIFTNLTRDHLDYHKDMNDYFAAKERLFHELLPGGATAIVNGDDPWLRKVRVGEGVTTWWFGQKDADYLFHILRQDLNGTRFSLKTPRGDCEIELPTPGTHNVYNAVAAAATALAAGASLATVKTALAQFHGAPGRLEKIANTRGLHIFVDYAHTDDALRSVLNALRELSRGRMITVCGCGGDRDKGKRPLMAKAAAENSAVLILTSDNPRSEDPRLILNDMQKGIPANWNGSLQIEPDRRKALANALQTAREDDVILVAGKGHENYQIVGDQTLSFSDAEVIAELLKE